MSLFKKIRKSLAGVEKNTFKHLSKLIENESEIILDADFTLDESEIDEFRNGIRISRTDIVINGNGHAIDAKGNARIFEIAANGITLKGIVFRNCSVEFQHGGAINNASEGLIIENCVFEGNSTKWDGGAINNEGSVFIENSIFRNNSSKKSGGAISSSGKLRISSCRFISNSCDYEGGAIYAKNIVDIENSKFCDNHARYGAGICIYHTCKVTIVDSAFMNALEGEHELIAVEDCDFAMKRCMLSNNHQSAGISSRRSNLDIWECTFNDNLNAIGCQQSDLTLSDSRFIGNLKSISNDNYMSIRKCEFTESLKSEFTIRLDGDEDSAFTIESSTFKCKSSKVIDLVRGHCLCEHNTFNLNDNYALFNENGEIRTKKDKFHNADKCIYNNAVLKSDDDIVGIVENGENSNLKLSMEILPVNHKGFSHLESLIGKSDEVSLDCNITMHESERNFFEGGIEISRDNLKINGNGHEIDGCEFSRIFYISAKNVTIENIIFKNGKYFKDKFDSTLCGGGAIHVLHGASLKLVNCIFKDNSSRQSSGAIKSSGDEMIISNCRFENNVAHNGNSGAIYNEKGIVTIESTEFNENHSKFCGGAIYNRDGELKITSCEFNGNDVENEFFKDQMGGGIYNENGELFVRNTTFMQNQCKKGGGIFNKGDSFKIEDSYFNENHAEEGASIYNLNKNEFAFRNCTFENNESQGAGIYNDGSIIYLEECNFNDNHSTHPGGAVYNNKGTVNLKHCGFKSNRAVFGKCGGAMGSFYGTTNIEYCNFYRNSARNGGAIENYGGKWSLVCCNFDENVSDWKGGSILNRESGYMKLTNCNFNNNEARNATDIYNLEGEMEFIGCGFENNEETIIINKDTITLEGCRLADYHEIFDFENAPTNILK